MSEHYTDSWNHYLNSIYTNNRIEKKQKRRLLQSVQTLRKNLGEDWPATSKDSNHEILWLLRTISGAVSDSLLIIWGDFMSAVEDVKGFEDVMDRIKNPNSFASSIAEMEMAGRLAKPGRCIEFEASAGEKKPDILYQDEKSRFFVEVKTLGTAVKTAKATNTATGILAACRPIFPTGMIFKSLSKPHLDEIAGILSQKVKHAISHRIGVEVDIKDVLKIYLVPDKLPKRVKMYKEWLDMQENAGVMPKGGGGLHGPPDNARQEHRVKTRINKVAREHQIPSEYTGVLVITGHFLFWDVSDVEKFVDSIIEDVYEQDNIAAVVLVSSKIFGEVDIQTVERRDFVFIRNQLYEWVGEDTVIVKNRFFKSEFDYENLKSLLLVNG